MAWQIDVLNKAVEKELEALPSDLLAKFVHITELIQLFGPGEVREPYVKPIKLNSGSKLWEIRMRGKSGIARAIYVTVTGKRIIILLAFIKKTDKTPQRILETAVKRLKEVRDEKAI